MQRFFTSIGQALYGRATASVGGLCLRALRRSVARPSVPSVPAVSVGGQCLRDLRDLSGRPPERKKNAQILSRFPVRWNLSCPQIWGATPPPPPVYILYVYCCSKRGQNEGISPAFEDTFRLTKRSLRANQPRFRIGIPCRRLATKYFNRNRYTLRVEHLCS